MFLQYTSFPPQRKCEYSWSSFAHNQTSALVEKRDQTIDTLCLTHDCTVSIKHKQNACYIFLCILDCSAPQDGKKVKSKWLKNVENKGISYKIRQKWNTDLSHTCTELQFLFKYPRRFICISFAVKVF